MAKVRSFSLRQWKARRPVFALYLAVLVLPLNLSLRLRDAGHSPYWPFPLLVGFLMLFAQFVSSFASIGGAPESPDASSGEKAQEAFGLLIFALMSIYAAFARSCPSPYLNEVPND